MPRPTRTPAEPADAGVARWLTLVLAVALLVGGGATVTWAALTQQSPPQPAADAAGTLDATASGAPPAPTGTRSGGTAADEAAPSVTGPVLDRSEPVSLTIPTIDVTSQLITVGRNPDGTLEVPQPGPDYDRAAWYRYSPTPGELGPSVIEGHVDSAANGPSVFYRLGDLRPGDTVQVTRADSSTATFTVDGVRSYPKDDFPTLTVYGNTDHAALRLITCGGTFDDSIGHYRDNIVVFAHLTSSGTA